MRVAVLMIFCLAASCSTEHAANGKRANASPSAAPAGANVLKDPSPSAPTGAPQQTTGAPQTSPAAASGAGTEAYFTATILPVLNTNCASCHADPRQQVPLRGPLTIFSYPAMRKLLADGRNSQSNAFYNKFRNILPHEGGDRCLDGITATPCKELIAWWDAELGTAAAMPSAGPGSASPGPGLPPVQTAGGMVGNVITVSDFGRVYGYAYDAKNTASTATVTFYADAATGTAIGTTMANLVGDDANTPGDHAFTFDLPATLRDGKKHTLYVYAAAGGTPELVTTKPVPFTAYGFTAAGRAYFDSTVKGKLSACTGCHAVAYDIQYYLLMAPTPASGGTAGNNGLINKPAQANGTKHGGGQRCSSVNASPCTELQQWWKLEAGG